MQFDTFLPEPFYRVASRALIFDDGNLLVVQNNENQWEIPGGGWDHEEPFETCLKREIHEELGVDAETVGPIVLSYKARDRGNYMSLRLAAVVQLNSSDFSFVPEDMQDAQFISREQAGALAFSPGEGVTPEILDQIFALA